MEPESILETERMVLEPIGPAHAPALFGPLSDRRIYRYIPEDPPVSVEVLAYRYKLLSTRRSPDGRETWLNWAMRLRDTGEYVGLVEVTLRADRVAHLAYMVTPARWRQGLALEACRRVVAALFADPAVAAVRATIDTRNEASIALVRALGAAQIALHRDAAQFKGASSDEVVFELPRPATRAARTE